MITLFPENEPTVSVQAPFLNVYLQSDPLSDGETFEMEVVSVTRNGGLVVKNQDFALYYPAASTVKRMLLQALELYVQPDGRGYKLVSVINHKNKNKADLGCDFSSFRNWTKEGNDYTSLEPTSPTDPSAGSNPFLPPTPLIQSERKARTRAA